MSDVPIAVQANRTGDEQIRTGTLRAGTYYVQVSAYNGELVEGEPYALRLRTSQSLTRSDDCLPLPKPASEAPSAVKVDPTSLDPRTNTLFLVNTELFEQQYPDQLDAVLAYISAVSARADLGVIGAMIPVNSSGAVQTAYINRVLRMLVTRCVRTASCRRSAT